jgi:hypothetical protein
MQSGHRYEVLIDVRSEPRGCEHLFGPRLRWDVDVGNRPTQGAGILLGDARRVMSSTTIGDLRPVPKGSRIVPLSAMLRAATVVNNGLSKKGVGRTCTTGSPDQLNTCSDSQCIR